MDQNIDILLMKCLYHMDNQEHCEIIKITTQLIQLVNIQSFEPYSELFYNRGKAYLELGNVDKAFEDFTQEILISKNPLSYINRGNIYSKTKQMYKEAILDYTKVITQEQNYSYIAHFMRGQCYLETKDFDSAIKDLLMSIDLKAPFIALFNMLVNYSDFYKKYSEDIFKAIFKKYKSDDIATININNQDCKRKLYSYVPWDENTIDSIIHEYKYASNVFNFNDPNDPIIRLIDNTQNVKEISSKIRVGCLSIQSCNMLMFSHYADKHTGICIEYDPIDIKLENHLLCKVKYKEKLQVDLQNIMFFEQSDHVLSDSTFIDLFITKHKVWKYEEEYRFITYNQDKIYLPITAIYFGREMSGTDKKLVEKLIEDKKEDIKLYDVRVKKDNLFELESYSYEPKLL